MSVSANAREKKMRTYEAPSSPIAYFFWRQKMWAETTFALSMMEPWEKVLIWTITVLFTTLFLTGLIKYLPHHLGFVQRRAAYYLLGRETDAGELLGWAWNSGAEVTSGVRREISRLVSKVEL